MRPCHHGRIWASQGGLSRNKVAVGESAAGSPPTDRDQAVAPGSLQPGFTPHCTVLHYTRCTVRSWRTRSTPDRHRRTTKANWARSSAVEHLLCKEDALGSTPSGSIPHTRRRIATLNRSRQLDWSGHELMHYPAKARIGRVRRTLRQPPDVR